jgi:hypothetical protein
MTDKLRFTQPNTATTADSVEAAVKTVKQQPAKRSTTKATIADIIQTIVRPTELTIEGVAVAAMGAIDLQIAKGWYEDCICGFNDDGEPCTFWLGATETAEKLIERFFPNYGFWAKHTPQGCLLEVWAGGWTVLVGGTTNSGVFDPVFESPLEARQANNRVRRRSKGRHAKATAQAVTVAGVV